MYEHIVSFIKTYIKKYYYLRVHFSTLTFSFFYHFYIELCYF